MRAYLAIIRLTTRNAVRSHIFQLLLGLLILGVVALPAAVSGDGSPTGFIQVSLLYSLNVVMLLLSLSSIWLSCYILTHDIDSYQLHMVVTKPVSRIVVWLGKFTGVLLIHTVLLILSGIVIYGIVLYKVNHNPDLSPEDLQRIRSEVLVGRRIFLPDRPDIEGQAREKLQARIRELQEVGAEIDMSPQNQEKMLNDARATILAQMSELPPGRFLQWSYSGLPKQTSEPFFLRYRTYVDKVATEGQRMTQGQWVIMAPIVRQEEKANLAEKAAAAGYHLVQVPLPPEQIRSGEFHEKVLNPEHTMTPDNRLFILYVNLDPQNSTQYFQVGDGPRIMVRHTGFAANYSRAVLAIWLELLLLTSLACAAAAFFTMPTAIFAVISYLVAGSFASYLAGTSYFGGAADYIGYYVGKAVLWLVIPIHKFDITDMVAGGELIELSLLWGLVAKYLLFRALPFVIFGVLLYRRRELGLVIRK